MYVFTDFHHSSLLNSLILLFEKRLGGKVFRPIGTEWHKQGYWKVYDHPATVEQFLGIGGATPDGTQKLNEVVSFDTYFYDCYDIDSGSTNSAITYDGFMLMPIDYVIATLPQHVEPFKKLCDSHPNSPKLIYQIGNAWPVGTDITNYTKNIMSSAKIYIPNDCNSVIYHQEFDTSIFNAKHNEKYINQISSFVNCFSVDGMFRDDYNLFLKVEELLKNKYEMKCFGGQCRDGSANGSKELAKRIKDSQFIWHTKNGGDGYGHVLHNSAACGRPIIAKFSQYYGKLGADLLIDGHSAINIDGLSTHAIVEKILFYSDIDSYNRMSNNVYRNFKAVCNFNEEEKKIRQFLENLV